MFLRMVRFVVFWVVFLGLVHVAQAERPNVLLITVDTFRPDHLGAYGYSRETSPVLDRFAQEGVLFQNTISSSSWTTPGLLSVLTGLWAPTHGVDVRGKSLRPGTPTFATVLRKAGYAAPDILYLSSIPNLQNLGLTVSYKDRDTYLPNGDEVLFRALEAYRDSTFFLYYHYRNLHLPYSPSPPYDRMFTPEAFNPLGFGKEKVETVRRNVTIPQGSVVLQEEDQDWIVGLYDGQVREMDDAFFKPLYETLKRLGIYEKTLVIVTADHGEELMEHGFIGHPSTSFKGSAFDELLKIPLVMSCPSLLPQGRVVQMQVQNVDIFPTVLDLLALPVPEAVQGRSLMPVIRGEAMAERPAFTETTPGGYQATPEMLKMRIRAMRTSKWKLIHTHGPGVDRYELYDLEKDPEERQDVAVRYPDMTGQMRVELHQWVLASQPSVEENKLQPSSDVKVGPIQVLFPVDGATFGYEDVGKTVAVRWTGPEEMVYTIEYRVGEGNYHLEGEMSVQGNAAQYGPYTEEMWNMLALYNPFSFRVKAGETASPWVTFTVMPLEGATPSRLAMLGVATLFWWGEARLFLTGLGQGALQLIPLAARVKPVDMVSAGLLLAILTGLFRPLLLRLGTDRIWRWGMVLAYVGLIYSTLSVMPKIWGTLWGFTQGRIDYAGTVVTGMVLGVAPVWLMLRYRRLLPLLVLLPVAVGYVWVLMELGRSPAERLHLAEYGLLSFLVFRALRIDMPKGAAYLWGVLIAACVGGVDEGIQWVLPSRVFEWKDVGLNLLSSALGMAMVAIFQVFEQEDGE
ncbi:MAG: VanZ family protein [bacterium]|nr:VanZ family protein [bacterium]